MSDTATQETTKNEELDLALEFYTPERRDDIVAWYRGHGKWPIPEEALPGLGLVALDEEGQPCAAIWLYMDNSVGVAFPSGFVTRPRNSLGLTRRAGFKLMEFIENECRAMGYGLLISHTRPGVARMLSRIGFETGPSELVMVTKLIEQ